MTPGGIMRLHRYTRAVSTASVIAAGLVVAMQAPAQAAWAQDQFDIAVTSSYRDKTSWGTVSWGNRTAAITGTVYDGGGDLATATVIFEAFAGSTKIDSQTRTANEMTELGGTRGYSFSIGDPDLSGGIDRIKITVRQNIWDGSNHYDSPTFQVHRDAVAENRYN